MTSDHQDENDRLNLGPIELLEKVSELGEEIEVDGILVPISWSGKNQVGELALYTAGEKEFYIDSGNPKGRELKKLSGKRISLIGELSDEKANPKKLLVKTYEVLDWS